MFVKSFEEFKQVNPEATEEDYQKVKEIINDIIKMESKTLQVNQKDFDKYLKEHQNSGKHSGELLDEFIQLKRN